MRAASFLKESQTISLHKEEMKLKRLTLNKQELDKLQVDRYKTRS